MPVIDSDAPSRVGEELAREAGALRRACTVQREREEGHLEAGGEERRRHDRGRIERGMAHAEAVKPDHGGAWPPIAVPPELGVDDAVLGKRAELRGVRRVRWLIGARERDGQALAVGHPRAGSERDLGYGAGALEEAEEAAGIVGEGRLLVEARRGAERLHLVGRWHERPVDQYPRRADREVIGRSRRPP
jgi:hypothetical protein